MVGLSFSATEHIVLSAGYRYFGTLNPEFNYTVPGLAFGTIEAEVGVHEIVMGLRYEF
jgi:opacity protein-like surface antigen